MLKKTVLFVFLICFCLPAFAEVNRTAYERVMSSGEIRCGYAVGAPYLMKDVLSGKLSGIWYDYVEAMAQALGLKIVWAEEVGLGEISTALDSGRIDAFCVGLWVSPERAKVMDFVEPITYQIVNAYVRHGEKSFDNSLDKINNDIYTVSCIDGEMSASIADQDFPKTKKLCLPQLSPFSDMLMNVMNKKADIVFASPAAIAAFNLSNPPGLQLVNSKYPLRLFPESIPVSILSDDLRRVLDHTTRFLINSGKIESILKKYSQSSSEFIRLAKPYETDK